MKMYIFNISLSSLFIFNKNYIMYSFVTVNNNLFFGKNSRNDNKFILKVCKNSKISSIIKFNIQMNFRGEIKKASKNFSHFFKKIFSIKKFIGISTLYFTTNSILIDTSKLNIKQEDVINETFLFSPKTTQPSDIESEIEEIEDDEYRYRNWKNTQIGLALGGSAIGMWFAYKGLNVWEKWMKDQEQKDIEEEIQMTGTYINPGAGNVEISIDPITGKKIQIKPLKKDSSTK
nr:hypothetical protein CcurKRNrm1_p087 [Cryptomonas curvata]